MRSGKQGTVVVESVVPAPAERVWARATTAAGIRHELLPVVLMTMPPGLRGKTLDDAGDLLGKPLSKAWLLLLGILPVEYDDMTIIGFEAGREFHERSTMLTLTPWEHRRTITPEGDHEARVRDELTFTPRLPGLPVAAIVRALFRHRHRRLTRYWTAAR